MSEATAGIHVECHAGYRGEETPRRFFLGERTIEVADILDRWLGPVHRYFKVRGDDGGRLCGRFLTGEKRMNAAEEKPELKMIHLKIAA